MFAAYLQGLKKIPVTSDPLEVREIFFTKKTNSAVFFEVGAPAIQGIKELFAKLKHTLPHENHTIALQSIFSRQTLQPLTRAAKSYRFMGMTGIGSWFMEEDVENFQDKAQLSEKLLTEFGRMVAPCMPDNECFLDIRKIAPYKLHKRYHTDREQGLASSDNLVANLALEGAPTDLPLNPTPENCIQFINFTRFYHRSDLGSVHPQKFRHLLQAQPLPSNSL